MYELLNSARLRNIENEEFFKKYGFIHIPDFIDKSIVKLIFSEFDKIHIPDYSKNQWNSQFDLSYQNALRTSSIIKKYLYPSFDRHFIDFDLPMASIMSKNPIPNSTCELHRDYTAFEEKEVQVRNFWIPLVDINADNGALYAIPGSYKLFTDIRPMFSDWAYSKIKDEILKFKIAFYIKAGDLILYADKTLHGSFENMTTMPRPVLHGGVLPKNAQVYFYKNEGSKVYQYAVDSDFFMKADFLDKDKLSKYPLVKTFPYRNADVKIKDIIPAISKLHREFQMDYTVRP